MRRSRCWRNLRYSASSIYPSNNQTMDWPKKKITKKTTTHDDKCDVGPVRPRESPQLSADRRDLFDARALPDTAHNARSTIEGLAPLEQAQPHRVQLPLVQHSVRQVVQQPGIRPMPSRCTATGV
jgi:hypothetical protein